MWRRLEYGSVRVEPWTGFQGGQSIRRRLLLEGVRGANSPGAGRTVSAIQDWDAMEQPGSNVQLLRFTLHSLRDRYANIALHVWKYTEERLLQQGSWRDAETVRRLYSGITDQTLAQAMAIHGWSPSEEPASLTRNSPSEVQRPGDPLQEKGVTWRPWL